MANQQKHDYHIVNPSAWPLVGTIAVFLTAFGFVTSLHNPWWGSGGEYAVPAAIVFFSGCLLVLYTFIAWWRDIINEGKTGHHTRVVNLHFRYAMVLFIASEVMFFAAWFWAFFDGSILVNDAIQATKVEVTGGQWPPKGIEAVDPFGLPLLNTVILLLSGTTVTWAHYSLLQKNRKGMLLGLATTIALGVLFLFVQMYEYSHISIPFSDNIYGATFYMATGFHGTHVFIGAIFLIVCFFRARRGDYTPQEHFSFEAAAWYWHFVDVVWLFLFIFVYIWGYNWQ